LLEGDASQRKVAKPMKKTLREILEGEENKKFRLPHSETK
jgi:hypothetical protein